MASSIGSHRDPSPNPLGFFRRALRQHGLEYTYLELEAKLSDLFVTETGISKLEVLEICPSRCSKTLLAPTAESSEHGSKANVLKWASNVGELKVALAQKSLPGSSRILILHRLNSWSRIDVTFEMFQTICASHQITPRFLNFVLGLGRKFTSWDEDFMSCYSCISPSNRHKASRKNKHSKAMEDSPAADLCYNIRHFQRHGRDLEDPWSCRQSAIHQKYTFHTGQSTWVVIQPPLLFTSTLKSSKPANSPHPMSVHILYLVASTASWREYLNHIADRLQSLDRNVAICKPYSEFGLSFLTKQQVHQLQQRLYHTRSILANTLRTVSSIGTHEEDLAKVCNFSTSIHDGFQRELRNLISELRNYQETTRKLLGLANNIRLMYDDILKFHGQELMYHHVMELTRIARAESVETKVMVTLANQTCQDSRTTRIATIVAMLYLPANLVTSFFSTTFVWFEKDSEAASSRGQDFVLRVHREIWIAVLTTAVLVAGTILASSWWERREKRLRPKNIC